MRATRLLRETLAQHLAVRRGDDAAYARVGVGKKKRLGGEAKRLDNVGGGYCVRMHGATMLR